MKRKNNSPPHPMDIQVGQRLRAARLLAGFSQSKLGDHVGLTFQQIQKYEKGMNRIGASRLQQFAQLLNVPAAYFFEQQPDAGMAEICAGQQPAPGFAEPLVTVLRSDQTRDLMEHFDRIQSEAMRASILHLVKTAANQGGAELG